MSIADRVNADTSIPPSFCPLADRQPGGWRCGRGYRPGGDYCRSKGAGGRAFAPRRPLQGLPEEPERSTAQSRGCSTGSVRNGSGLAAGSMGGPAAVRAADRNLATLPPRARQAFLLVAVEEFRPAEAARAMDVSEAELQALDRGGRARYRQAGCHRGGDHRGRAADRARPRSTRQRPGPPRGKGGPHCRAGGGRHAQPAAGARAGRHPPGRRQLRPRRCRRRSCARSRCPWCAYSAFLQRLLTGTRPEPTFLVTKPFQPQNVKAVISQALFFDIRGRPEGRYAGVVFRRGRRRGVGCNRALARLAPIRGNSVQSASAGVRLPQVTRRTPARRCGRRA